ncbi:SMI1/KNR4 family protein [Actinomadura rupiterrae]|uniref:SMI1/KNR4 family protein n=1 Tax=Actinomadura rupiterrae TaxID=559627 RepID=UPI0020A3EADC|nr:SMI1/KNR4 family protein [Actinomadura rupiterrae]MCP2337747.1 hypothetical protein [Actinomadura rupiterrae]
MSDSDLIARLRRRAYDPALRLDTVCVPTDWLRLNFGAHAHSKFSVSHGGGRYGVEEKFLPAGAFKARLFYEDTPHEPPYPPVTMAELHAAEEQLGRRLPELLRRMYTEVANGGFGPNHGILGLADGGPHDDRTAVQEYLEHPELNDDLGFPLIAGGCNVWWYVSLTQPGNPVHLFDWDGWDWPERDPPTAAVAYTAPTLADWLGRWADGQDVWSY